MRAARSVTMLKNFTECHRNSFNHSSSVEVTKIATFSLLVRFSSGNWNISTDIPVCLLVDGYLLGTPET